MNFERGTVGQEDQGPWAPWKEVGSRGLDTWFELPAGHGAMAEGSGGEAGGSYVHSSVVEDYLATLEGQEAHEEEGYDGHYYAWLNYVLRRLGVKVREEG